MTKRPRGVRRRRIATAVLTVTLLGVVGCGSAKQSTDSATSKNDPTNAANGAANVSLKLVAYTPNTVEVRAGSSVKWTQEDPGFHTVTSGTVAKDGSGSVKANSDGAFASGQLAKGSEFAFTFAKAGTYRYFCEIHPATMTGTVRVK